MKDVLLHRTGTEESNVGRLSLGQHSAYGPQFKGQKWRAASPATSWSLSIQSVQNFLESAPVG